MCDSFGNKCFYQTMNWNQNASKECSHCDYDCNKTTHTSSFVMRPIDPEVFCTDALNYPIVDIKKYINIEPSFKKNPKLFYLKWKALVDGKEYRFDNEKHCRWKAENDFAIVNVYLSTPTIPRMKQDVKVKIPDKLALLGNSHFKLLLHCLKRSIYLDHSMDIKPCSFYFRWDFWIVVRVQHLEHF